MTDADRLARLRHERSTFDAAASFVGEHHRHHTPPIGHLFSIAAYRGERRVGVVIVGRPVSRHRDDGLTAEITRLCVLDDEPNACSFLYGKAAKAALALGFRRIGTYTLAVTPALRQASDDRQAPLGGSMTTSADRLAEALRELRSYAASVWFDEATANDEEREAMEAARLALAAHDASPRETGETEPSDDCHWPACVRGVAAGKRCAECPHLPSVDGPPDRSPIPPPTEEEIEAGAWAMWSTALGLDISLPGSREDPKGPWPKLALTALTAFVDGRNGK